MNADVPSTAFALVGLVWFTAGVLLGALVGVTMRRRMRPTLHAVAPGPLEDRTYCGRLSADSFHVFLPYTQRPRTALSAAWLAGAKVCRACMSGTA